MSIHIEFQEHFAGSNKLFISVWVWLLLLTGLEVFLGYIHLPVTYMLVILMGASIIKAALIVAYFMHLRFERINCCFNLIVDPGFIFVPQCHLEFVRFLDGSR